MNTKNQYPESITIFIEIHAKAGEEEFTKQTFKTTIETSNKPGLISYEIFEDSNAPGTFYSTQEWESVKAFHAHMSEAKSAGIVEATSMLREMPRTSILKRIGKSENL
ncbi:putative quinol monooxygenase [Paenibacillus monticola]|uniref:Antibiotic biosynthesis monooxygenase n=1 Tax=Paenibacillus monticola TaxID=2666075 RepID=A0A7X2H5S0_9BACL|nr:antibiotic biosynthesis monooxygenase [Paenibacillus monticola]MRN53940.1 antibiotic biosynthesis monooxygenase [Paenibacillus monticola]